MVIGVNVCEVGEKPPTATSSENYLDPSHDKFLNTPLRRAVEFSKSQVIVAWVTCHL